MIWYKITLPLSDIAAQKALNNKIIQICEKYNTQGLNLYQADPGYNVDYYISCERNQKWMLSELKTEFSTTPVDKPNLSKIFLKVGQANTVKYLPLIRW